MPEFKWRGELAKDGGINGALKKRRFAQCPAMVVPFPFFKFGRIAAEKFDVAVAADKSQQEPNLLLSAIIFRVAPQIFGDFVAQPIACAGEQLHLFADDSGFFVEFPIHCVLRRFAVQNAALRKLPKSLINSPRPKNLAGGINQNDSNIGTVAVVWWHCRIKLKKCRRHFTANARRLFFRNLRRLADADGIK